MGEDQHKQPAPQFFHQACFYFLFCPFAKGGQQVGVLDAGRAGCFAGHAAEAPVNMRQGLFQGEALLQYILHEDDATSRGVHFLSHDLVGGTGGQAETAVYAGLDGVRHQSAHGSQLFLVDRVLHDQLPNNSGSGDRFNQFRQVVAGVANQAGDGPGLHFFGWILLKEA